MQLTQEQINRIVAFKKRLEDVDNASLEVVIKNFMGDSNPESEIIVWEKIATRYEEIINKLDAPSTEEKKAAFGAALQESFNADPITVVKTSN